MWKLIPIIILFSLCLLSADELYKLNNNALGLKFSDHLLPLVRFKGEESIYSDEKYFNPAAHLQVYSRSAYKIKTLNPQKEYKPGLNSCHLVIENAAGKVEVAYPFKVVKRPIEKEIIYLKPEFKPTSPKVQEKDVTEVTAYHNFKVPLNYPFADFLALIAKDLKGDVTVDYHSVNLSCKGTYPLYYHDKEGSHQALVIVD